MTQDSPRPLSLIAPPGGHAEWLAALTTRIHGAQQRAAPAVNRAGCFLDLLICHLQLRCHVVVELKADEFEPQHLGPPGCCLTAVDTQVKDEHDNPTIGLLLCKSRNQVVAEYALRDKTQPPGTAACRMLESLPAELQGEL